MAYLHCVVLQKLQDSAQLVTNICKPLEQPKSSHSQIKKSLCPQKDPLRSFPELHAYTQLYSTVVLYRNHGGLGISSPKI